MNKPILLAAAAALAASATVALAQTTPPTTQPRTTPTAPMAPTTAATATTAKAQIEASGYTNVKNLQRKEDGSWQARAIKNNTEVAISVDPKGTVTQLSQ
jgi:hypothetical protein